MTEIEEYLNSLPEYIMTINLENNNLDVLPDLSRFTNLQYLHCSFNVLTSLPKLNETLLGLYCSNNKLTSLPKLNKCLKLIYCCDNELTILPEFNEHLEEVFCCYNYIISFPELNPDFHTNLRHVDYHFNPVFDNSIIEKKNFDTVIKENHQKYMDELNLKLNCNGKEKIHY